MVQHSPDSIACALPGICIWHCLHAKACSVKALLTRVTYHHGIRAAFQSAASADCGWVNRTVRLSCGPTACCCIVVWRRGLLAVCACCCCVLQTCHLCAVGGNCCQRLLLFACARWLRLPRMIPEPHCSAVLATLKFARCHAVAGVNRW